MRIIPPVRSIILSYRLKFLFDPTTSPQLTLNNCDSKTCHTKINRQTYKQTLTNTATDRKVSMIKLSQKSHVY